MIQPSIDAFSPKNQDLDEATIRTILVHAGLVEGPLGLLLRMLGLLEPAARIELDPQVETAFGEGIQAAFSI